MSGMHLEVGWLHNRCMEASSASCHIINIFNGKVLNNASAMLLLFQGLQCKIPTRELVSKYLQLNTF
jgi:hypothetical protein